MVLLLFESPAGLALFKVVKDKKLQSADAEDVWSSFETPEKAAEVVKLKAFNRFRSTTEALAAAASIAESKVDGSLKKFLKKHAGDDSLAVLDAKLGAAIKEKLSIPCIHSSNVGELVRGVRRQMSSLLGGLTNEELRPMSLGLAHSLSRYKLKFSPDKVDTMVVQAVGLLDDLDKELNVYAMRAREWYGWHFPELSKLIVEHATYAKVVRLMGTREKAADLDMSGVLDEETEAAVKEAAIVSMGTEMSEEDIAHVDALCAQIVSLHDYRSRLHAYLSARMMAVAPNLTALVGELVGARLIAHVGSLINLAKAPASTIQILGAEKALFRALKTKHETPKYGLLYHASIVGQAQARNKGKIARVLAAKCALGARVDALADNDDQGALGLESRLKVEARLRQLEGRGIDRAMQSATGTPAGKKGPTATTAATPTTNGVYNASADVRSTIKSEKKRKREDKEETIVPADDDSAVKKKKKDREEPKTEKKKKKKDKKDA